MGDFHIHRQVYFTNDLRSAHVLWSEVEYNDERHRDEHTRVRQEPGCEEEFLEFADLTDGFFMRTCLMRCGSVERSGAGDARIEQQGNMCV